MINEYNMIGMSEYIKEAGLVTKALKTGTNIIKGVTKGLSTGGRSVIKKYPGVEKHIFGSNNKFGGIGGPKPAIATAIAATPVVGSQFIPTRNTMKPISGMGGY